MTLTSFSLILAAFSASLDIIHGNWTLLELLFRSFSHLIFLHPAKPLPVLHPLEGKRISSKIWTCVWSLVLERLSTHDKMLSLLNLDVGVMSIRASETSFHLFIQSSGVTVVMFLDS